MPASATQVLHPWQRDHSDSLLRLCNRYQTVMFQGENVCQQPWYPWLQPVNIAGGFAITPHHHRYPKSHRNAALFYAENTVQSRQIQMDAYHRVSQIYLSI